MAQQIRLLCRTANTYGFHNNKIGFDLHNTRKDELKPEEKNYNQDESCNNIFYRNGKEFAHSQIEDLLQLVKLDQEEKIKSVRGEMSDKYIGELNLSRSKTKSKIKKWSDNSQEPEKDFFSNLLEKIGNEEINAENEIETLSSFGKVKRFNDKRKAILQLEKCNALFKVKENKSMTMKVISQEKIFKIPDKHNVEVKAEDWNKLIDEFHNRFYKDYDAYYTAIHLDEKKENPHAHHRLSGFNNKTKSFDLPDHELNLVRKLLKKPELFEGRKWSKLEPDEVQKFGQVYQKLMFQFCNEQLQKMGYKVKAVKRTPEEVEKDDHSYSNGKMRDRVFNGVEALKVEEKEIKQEIDQTKELAKKWNNKAKEQKKSAIDWNKKAKEQKGFFEKFADQKEEVKNWFKNDFPKWFDGILKYKKSRLSKDLDEPAKLHVDVENTRENVGKELLSQVDDLLEKDQLRMYNAKLKEAKRNRI